MKKKIVDMLKYRKQKKLALNRNEQKTRRGGGLPQGTSYRPVDVKIEGIILGKEWRGGGVNVLDSSTGTEFRASSLSNRTDAVRRRYMYMFTELLQHHFFYIYL